MRNCYKKENIDYIKKEMSYFFMMNLGNETKPQMVWDAYKTVIKGNLIAINCKEKTLKEQKLNVLQSKIANKELAKKTN